MSAIGVLVARVVSSVGGPVVTGAVIAGGIAVGALGGGLFASGGQQASAGEQLPVYPCPNTGPVLATIQAGQQVLATGRTADSTWLRIHYPSPGRGEAWVPAGPLTVEGAVASLPVAECLPELAIAPPSVGPDESFTVAQNNPPSAPPATATPTPTTGPTATPNVRPVVSSLTASTGQVSFDSGGYCPNAVKQVTFRVKATDAGGVAGVSLFWRKPGAGSFAETAMTRVSGTASNGTWQATLDTTANSINKAGSLAYYAQAKDGAGASRRIPVATTNSIQVKVCANTGPVITRATSSNGNTLFSNPLKAPGNCPNATRISATIKDVDGIASATLFYLAPGTTSFASQRMTLSSGRYVTSLGGSFTIKSPPTDPLRWYIRAVDTKGAVTTGPTSTITIRRCDTEADIGQSSYSPICVSMPTWIYSNAADPDGIGPTSAVVVYTYVLKDGTTRTARKQMVGNNDGRWYYSVSIQAGANWDLNRSPFNFYIETTDMYGGKTRGGDGKTQATSC